jgi:uncharacterized protein (TIGR03086 family)
MAGESASPHTSIPVLHRQALRSTRAFVAGIDAGKWANPTPCAEWDVRSLVNHIVVGNLWAAQLATGHTIDDVGDRLDGDLLGDSPLDAYDRSADAAGSAFEAQGALEAPCAVSYGPVPGSVYAGHRFLDVLIHGWDIAVATGQSPALPRHLVDACWDVVDPQLADLRASGMFGSHADPSASTDPQTRLLETLGRTVAAAPPHA